MILDEGTCIVGDLEPMEYLDAYYQTDLDIINDAILGRNMFLVIMAMLLSY